MGEVTSLFVRKVVAAAGGGLDPADLLGSVGLGPESPGDPAQMIPDSTYYDLLERIAHALPDATDLPLRVGATMRCDDYGAFGLAWKAAPTLRASLARAERYWRLLTSVAEYEVRAEGADAWFVLHRPGARRLGLRLSNEATMASVLSIMREVAPAPVVPLEVQFRHPAPPRTAAHAAAFGCPVRFDAGADALLVPAGALTRRNRLGDEGISRFLTAHLDAGLDRIVEAESLEDRVRQTVVRALADGVPTLATVARRLGTGERTLQRRLRAEGLSLAVIVQAARHDLARGLLTGSGHALAEVAFLTGFSEQSAFTRAFRRWSGETPAAFRARQQAGRA